jgi:hypothetical protein
MSDDPIIDMSRVDRYLHSRQRIGVLNAAWRPMLAGAAGAGLVIAAVAVAQPRFTTREVVVDHVVQKDVSVDHVVPRDVPVDHIVPKDVEIDIPRIVATSPAPTTPKERAFEGTPGWKEAVIRGRILRPDANGFVLATDNGETGFYPAKIGTGGKIEPDPSVRDVATPFIGALARCNQLPIGTYQCVALHDGRETAIAQAPIGAPL